MSNKSISVIIINKQGILKSLAIKDFKIDELYKKCGFKKSDGFELQVKWNVKLDGKQYLIQMYGKIDGKANFENKYDFPPPVDNKLLFGSCLLVGFIKDYTNENRPINLSIILWEKIYEKLFGGFEDLAKNSKKDDDEEDELENIPKHMKTKKGGYLKDGFIVDSSDTEEYYSESSDCNSNDNDLLNEEECELILEDIGSELSEEQYIESDDDIDKKK